MQMVEYNSSSSLYEQLLAMRDTTVFVSVHTSNLANAPLLQPGSAVFEIIQVRGPRRAISACLTGQRSLSRYHTCLPAPTTPEVRPLLARRALDDWLNEAAKSAHTLSQGKQQLASRHMLRAVRPRHAQFRGTLPRHMP